MDDPKEPVNIFDNPVPPNENPEDKSDEGEELTPEQIEELKTNAAKSANLETTVKELQDKIAELEKTPQATEPPQGEDWSKVPPAQRPWFIQGSTNKPRGWDDVVDLINKVKEDAKAETIQSIADVIQKERDRQVEQDQILDSEIQELKTAGQIKTEEQEIAVLETHKDIYGNIPLAPGQLKTAFKIWQERQKGGGSSEEEKTKQMKELASKSTPGGGTPPPGTPPAPPVRGRTFSLQDAAAEALAKMRRH